MFKSLRSRVFVSHLGVVMLVFTLVLITAFVPIRKAQERVEVRHLQDIAAPVVVQAGLLLQRPLLGPATIDDLLNAQARELNTRIILLDRSGDLLVDTSEERALPAQARDRIEQAISTFEDQATSGRIGIRRALSVPSQYIGVYDGQRVVIAQIPQVDDRFILLTAPVRRNPVIREFLGAASLSVAIGLAGAVVATVYLSRSITRPISRLTRASQAIADGDLEHRVPGEGDDEVGLLVASFNDMVARVRATNESQRHLLANIAHELRTPLTSIQGYAQALRDGVFAAEQQQDEALETISAESERVNELVVQILQLARLESGQAEPVFHEVAVDEVVARVMRRNRITAEGAGIELLAPEETQLTIRADDEMLEQAIDNLVRNAIRHTPTGGSVTVSLAPAVDATSGTRHLRIRVSDTGPGIPAAEIERVFERFYRGNGDEATRDATPGFGLGLAIVKEIVAKHGGSVGVESQVGQGTTFTLDLPLVSTYRAAVTSSTRTARTR